MCRTHASRRRPRGHIDMGDPDMRSKRTALSLALFTVAAGAVVLPIVASQPAATGSAGARSEPARAAYSHLPMRFERNRGQTDRRARFITRGPGYTLFLTRTEAV